MGYKIVCYTDDKNIRVRFSPDVYDQLRELPASRYHKNVEGHREFTFPKTASFADLISVKFSQLGENQKWFSDEFFQMMVEGDRYQNHRDTVDLLNPEAPSITKTEPWEHQKQAFTFVKDVDASALFMKMGTGKSKVAIDYIADSNDIELILIVGPNRVISNGEWHRQFERHYPADYFGEPNLVLLTANEAGTVAKRAEVLREKVATRSGSNHHVFMVNYESIWREPLAQEILDTPWDLVILDESHRIKAPGSKVSMFCSKLGDIVPRKLILTGTPMPNNPLDIYGQFRFLDKTVLGSSFSKFCQEHAIFGGYENRVFQRIKDDKRLDDIIGRYSFRVRSEDVLDLPEVMDERLTFQLSSKARKHYNDMENLFLTRLENGDVDASNILVQLLRLQQIVNGFLPVDIENEDGTTTTVWEDLHTDKRDFLKDLLIDLPKDAPIVVFAMYHGDLNNIRKAVEHKDVNLRYGELSGRRDDYHNYINGDVDVLAVQISAGAEGLNELVRSRYAIFYSTGYSLGKYLQARARLHRPGQNNNVVFYHIHGEGTIDETIFNTLQRKESVVDRFMPSRKGEFQDLQPEPELSVQ